jgi:hypothetical protein
MRGSGPHVLGADMGPIFAESRASGFDPVALRGGIGGIAGHPAIQRGQQNVAPDGAAALEPPPPCSTTTATHSVAHRSGP